MKKQFLLLGLAVAAMTSCTSDEVLEQVQPTKQAIGFEAFTDKATRAVAEATNSNLENFYVFGYYGSTSVFNNVEVTKAAAMDESGEELKDGEGNTIYEWSYTGDKKYWTQNTYQFAAYANGYETGNKLGETNVSFSNAKLTFADYTVTDDKDLIADVLVADNKNLTQSTVDFTFKHMLSKIQFVVNNTSQDYKMRIVSKIVKLGNDGNPISDTAVDGLVINGVKTQGTCTLDANGTTTWNTKDDSGTRTGFVPLSATDDAITAQDGIFAKYDGSDANKSYQKVSEEYFVMPQAVSGITFVIKAQFLDEANQVVKEKEVTGTLAGENIITDWEAGTFYTYHISLPTAAVPIEFSGNVNGFTPFGQDIELNYSDEDSNS